MNLREWARATHRALASQPAETRHKEFSAADVEQILRMGVTTLVEALVTDDDLRMEDLGRLWCETRSPRRGVSNLLSQPQAYNIQSRKMVRFRVSSRLQARINGVPHTHLEE